MAGNPNTGSADTNTGTDTNAMSARAGSTTASVSPVERSEGQQQRSRNAKQNSFHEDLPWLVIMATDIQKPQILFSRIDAPQVAMGRGGQWTSDPQRLGEVVNVNPPCDRPRATRSIRAFGML
jgi:hypothetical protein